MGSRVCQEMPHVETDRQATNFKLQNGNIFVTFPVSYDIQIEYRENWWIANWMNIYLNWSPFKVQSPGCKRERERERETNWMMQQIESKNL